MICPNQALVQQFRRIVRSLVFGLVQLEVDNFGGFCVLAGERFRLRAVLLFRRTVHKRLPELRVAARIQPIKSGNESVLRFIPGFNRVRAFPQRDNADIAIRRPIILDS